MPLLIAIARAYTTKVFFEAVELGRHEAAIPLATLRNAGAMRRIFEDNMAAAQSPEKQQQHDPYADEPGSPSELRVGPLNASVPGSPADGSGGGSPLTIGVGGRFTRGSGSTPSPNSTTTAGSLTRGGTGMVEGESEVRADDAGLPPIGTKVEVFSVSDGQWHSGSIVAHIAHDDDDDVNNGHAGAGAGVGEKRQLGQEEDELRPDVLTEYKHGSRQKALIWGDETLIRLLGTGNDGDNDGTLGTMMVAEQDEEEEESDGDEVSK
eukprot:COSAG06_NODE_3119_length_5828_cov_3.289754_2_plen_265_part_00